ncbi:MAG TPA: hypothetical protein VLW52_07140 [Opitutaceae bacterium]|nr:hypothetical protein [Opitutaceae bacterium]
MSDRLQELLRQKILLDEHVAWLQREIAAERARAGDCSPPASAAPPPVTAPPPAMTDREADAVLDQYRDSPQSLHQAVKRGCLLYFFGALAALGLGALVVYFASRAK